MKPIKGTLIFFINYSFDPGKLIFMSNFELFSFCEIFNILKFDNLFNP